MKLPNKVTSYKESTLSKLAPVLNKLKTKDYTVDSLYREVSSKINLSDFIDVLDILYVLDEITVNKEVVHYVKRDSI